MYQTKSCIDKQKGSPCSTFNSVQGSGNSTLSTNKSEAIHSTFQSSQVRRKTKVQQNTYKDLNIGTNKLNASDLEEKTAKAEKYLQLRG